MYYILYIIVSYNSLYRIMLYNNEVDTAKQNKPNQSTLTARETVFRHETKCFK